MTKTLGIIGAGMIGSTLARHAVDAGLNVVLSNSRDPETLSDLVSELGSRARAATPAEAALAGDLVVATIPLVAYEKLPVAALAGKTVIDTMNYYPERDGQISELDSGELTSSALVQRHLADSHVVKAFNNISFRSLLTLARPAGAPDRSALPIAGDDPTAKTDAAELLDTLGYDTVDIGTLADSWRSEPNTPVYAQPYLQGQPPEGAGQEEVMSWFLAVEGVPVLAHRVKELTGGAVRGPAGGKFS
ncbi:NAD(P)-binding domain-containing protein [Streptomyces sp. ISL-22]|uniref:NADPH-dependent F420 reductase n=1 Tax=unclassified Streptomyces TaxID=2593676 RepID=UPI001BE87827|nr:MULTISPECIES: NAD(P)-binding domain-containing protein [unclassified Streptomyces]MBT2417344.1 NAD(P)-binding domain-containing protein [Streptomyces sp. ISL-24]MBT2434620.1 NAD(P)-binding domain-containing protein [Streptomyces sp. ISL-22]